MKHSRRSYIEAAAIARSNLNIFYAVIGLLEGGTIVGQKSVKAADRIIHICKERSLRELSIYDNAVEEACAD